MDNIEKINFGGFPKIIPITKDYKQKMEFNENISKNKKSTLKNIINIKDILG